MIDATAMTNMPGGTSPRHPVLRNIVRRTTAEFQDPPLPNPGDMKLNSFYTLSMAAGTYTITPTQHIDIPPTMVVDNHRQTDLSNDTAQSFEVVAPQFSIDPKDVHSCYPPQGHADQAKILPHIVFNDEHLPWERFAMTAAEQDAMPDTHINKIPWLALLVFDPNGADQELRLDSATATKLLPKSAWDGIPAGGQVQKSTSLSVSMPVNDFMALKSNGVTIPDFTATNSWNSDRDGSKRVETIFISAKMFNAFFPQSTSDATKRDLGKYRFLSHVRYVNTVGCVQSGVQDQGRFSIVVSHRSGPLDIKPNTLPRTQIVHLVSIENVHNINQAPADGSYAALISLASWTYQCLPPIGVNFVDAMHDIGMLVKTEPCLLRPPEVTLAAVAKAAALDTLTTKKARMSVYERMAAGYSLVRHRLQTGEETIAFTRGPLVPVKTVHINKPEDAEKAHPLSASWRGSSNFGQAYEIVDPDLGMVDISYSAAWQLGKTLTMADGNIVAVLLRLRNAVHTTAVGAVKTNVALAANGFKTTSQLLSNLPTTVSRLRTVANKGPGPPVKRWSIPSKTVADTIKTPTIPTGPNKAVFRDAITTALSGVGSGLGDDQKPFEEIRPANSTDWAQLHGYIMDKLSLQSIPYQYLVTDSSHLPSETIRFFHIDATWMDCFIDGCLSIANHLSRADDDVRRGIKQQLNAYFSTELHDEYLKHFPQVPTYGFLLRSKVVECLPDMRIEVPFPPASDDATGPDADTDRAKILSLRNLSKDTVICLLDRTPDSGELKMIKISQPNHQQCYSVGDYLDDAYIEVKNRKVPATLETAQKIDPEEGFDTFDAIKWNKPTTAAPADPNNLPPYDWSSRCLDLNIFNATLMKQLTDPNYAEHDKWDVNTTPSALVSLELNDPVYHLELIPPVVASARSTTTAPDPRGTPRVIWIGPPDPTTVTASMARTAQPRPAGLVARSRTIVSRAAVSRDAAASTAPAAVPQMPSQFVSVRPTPTPLPDWYSGDPSKPKSSFGPVDTTLRDLNQAQYPFACFPWNFDRAADRLRPSPTPSFAPTNSPYNIDLIFSFNRSSSLDHYELFELELKLPLGPLTPASSSERRLFPLPLLDYYSGPGARMLSNQRWVVRIDREPDWLVCRCIPRSQRWTSPLARNANLSFRLNGVDVEGAAGQCRVKVTERYRRLVSKQPVVWQVQGTAVQQKAFLRKTADWAPVGGW